MRDVDVFRGVPGGTPTTGEPQDRIRSRIKGADVPNINETLLTALSELFENLPNEPVAPKAQTYVNELLMHTHTPFQFLHSNPMPRYFEIETYKYDGSDRFYRWAVHKLVGTYSGYEKNPVLFMKSLFRNNTQNTLLYLELHDPQNHKDIVISRDVISSRSDDKWYVTTQDTNSRSIPVKKNDVMSEIQRATSLLKGNTGTLFSFLNQQTCMMEHLRRVMVQSNGNIFVVYRMAAINGTG